MGINTLAGSTPRARLVRGTAPQWSQQPRQQQFGADDGAAGGVGGSEGGEGGKSGDSAGAAGAAGGGAGSGGEGGKATEYTPPATQADLDKIIQDRIERAKKPFADYDQQKADAEKWRQAEKEKLPAEQRTAQEIEELRRENESLKSAQLRSDVATAKGVPAQLITGSTKEELEAAADALLAFRGPVAGSPLVDNENAGTSGSGNNNSTDWLGNALRDRS
ncbi:hypothetical protein CH298_13395 [Rhodococcoides fascians]|uniref:hypothetical protein n=1 Tax=Rhodococcoides fascians TaxID=1828 RepID=UPI000B9B2468|nr:hypothetical protein [Rhodococcus fascians]OZE89972.1 hypothetical protein CH303_13275 [Rhodococcus fascians]OZF18279.1 hypothetical protein CH298_13395 [Rhodococcus fascians]OZF21730.1 hypothetical protein CH297_13290 [Rhodococcus fascians]OZF67355.1 hypothetical protein CH308_13190 [Rhodococcus fascians]OZF70545.1 hypothetical protein CH307_13385 [Rhodococcus fascians]